MKRWLLTLVAGMTSAVLIPCSDSPHPDYSYYNFFEKSVKRSYHLMEFLDGYYETPNEQGDYRDANLETWVKYWGGRVNEDDVRQIVYGSETQDIKNIQKNLKKLSKLPAEWQQNTVVQYCAANNEKASLAYLVYANECEPYLYGPEYDWETYTEIPVDPVPMLKMVEQGKKLYAKEKNKELKLRYAFQMMRLMHYAGEQESAIVFFDEYVKPLANDGYMYYRALEHLAGVYYNMNAPEAAYLYAKIFAKNPERRGVCMLSFQMTGDTWWEKAMAMCQDNDERVAFYTLRGLTHGGYMLEEMENIAKIDPNSRQLEFLISREIDKLERKAFPMYPEWAEEEDIAKDPILPRLEAFCRQLAGNTAVKKSDFWRVTEAYLVLFQGNAASSRQLLETISVQSEYHPQATVLDFVAQLMDVKRPDEASEKAIYAALTANATIDQHPHTRALLFDVFARLYLQERDWAKSFLCHQSLDALQFNLNIDLIDALQAFVKKNSFNPFEKELLQRAGIGNVQEAANRLTEMRGTYYFQRGQLDKAIEIYQQLPADFAKNDPHFNKKDYLNESLFSYSDNSFLFSEPFDEQSEPLYDGIPALKRNFNRLSLAQTLRNLEQRAVARPDSAAQYYFILACAWMNMSPHGWHRPALDYYDSNYAYTGWLFAGITPEKGDEKNPFHYYPEYHYYDAQRVLNYFDKAYNATKDRELKAKIAFAAAQAEQHKFYSEATWKTAYQLPSERDAQYLQNFKRLKYDLNDTKYYQQMIGECYYLADYVNMD